MAIESSDGPTQVRRILRSSRTTPSAVSDVIFNVHLCFVRRSYLAIRADIKQLIFFFRYGSRTFYKSLVLIYIPFRIANCNGNINNISNNNEDVSSRVNLLYTAEFIQFCYINSIFSLYFQHKLISHL